MNFGVKIIARIDTFKRVYIDIIGHDLYQLKTRSRLREAPISLFIHFVSLASLCSLHLLKKALSKVSYLQQLLVLVLIICSFSVIASYVVYSLVPFESLTLLEFLLRNSSFKKRPNIFINICKFFTENF